MHVTSRRGFLKIAAAGAAGAALSPALGRAAGKTVTLLHESSFIPPFDEYMQNVLAPAYEKETGVKIVYEIISVGSSPARIASISETGTGADITMNLILIPFLYDENTPMSATSPRWERSRAAGTPPPGKWRSSTANGRRSRSARSGS